MATIVTLSPGKVLIGSCGINQFNSCLWPQPWNPALFTFCTKKMSLFDLKQWASGRMVPYQIPTVLLVVDELPRNTMGKVNKKELNAMFFGMK